MILSFTIDNWMSFRDRVSFSMVASRERQHGERVSKINKYRTRILPIAALYGGNASGKSNFFKAIQFVKKLVVEGTKVDESIPVEPFKLDSTSASQPSSFALELMIDETIY
ncbi:MAG: AAA family ATPase, partial [Calditrichaeota bacterium]|nr:AAA family ATPase [Calditrichota bacterium]